MVRKRLLVLTSTFPRWAGDNEPPFVFELCRHLKTDFEVIVLAPHAPGASLRDMLDGLDVRRFRYCLAKWEILAYEGGIMAKLKRNAWCYLLVPLFLACQLLALLRIVKNENIDIIHAHWLIPQGLTSTICRLVRWRKVPALLCTSHGTDLLGLRGAFLGWLKQYVLRRADMITVVSQSMRAHALTLRTPPERLFVIPMGIDAIDKFTPSHSGERNASELLFVGRLVESKAVDVLLKAMPEILTKRPEVTLTIVGDGPQKDSLIALANTLGIGDSVNFSGAVENGALPSFYRRAGIFVSPSRSEGFGLTIAESLACECAVISSDLPALRELIIDGETGIIVPPGEIVPLSRAILAILAAPELRDSLGRAGRRFIMHRFDWNTIAENYADLLHRLSASPPP